MHLKDTQRLPKLKGRSPLSHKGQNGRVLVVGGSVDYYGSPALVALAATNAGADLAYCLVPERIADTVASYSPDLIVRSYPGTQLNSSARAQLKLLSTKTDVLVIGNGLTKQPTVLREVKDLVAWWSKPIVIDADAIRPSIRKSGAVYTPHSGEFARMTGEKISPRERTAREQVRDAAAGLHSTILLKSHMDIISDGRRLATNHTGNPGMTCGGTGDVLAGVLATFLAHGYSSFDAATLAAWAAGTAGDLALKKLGYFSLRATDVIEQVPTALGRLRAAQKA